MPQDIIEGRITIDAIAQITEEKAQSLARHRVRLNDIVFSRRGDLSRATAILEHESGWFCGTGCFLLRVPKDALDAQWLSHIYRYPLVQRQVDANAVGSTMPSLNNAVMSNLSIPFPNVDEQMKVRQRLDALDQKSRTEQLLRDKLLLEKTGLMQDLLTGKVRVNVVEVDEVTANV
jgi:type I restriction enzyme S subunit